MVERMNRPRREDLGSLSGSEWDVIVVGAGPAGTMAGLTAARGGRKVLLVDKSRFPRYKVCGCCLNGRALGVLHTVGQLDVVRRQGLPLDSLVLAAGRHRARVPLPQGLALSRVALDATLADAAIREGAGFLDECKAQLDRSQPEGWVVKLTRDRDSVEVFARIVLAADGLTHGLSKVRPARPRRSPIGAGVMLDGAARACPRGAISMAVGRGGYVGLVRVEGGRLNVAAALDPELVRRRGGLGPASESVLRQAGVSVPEGLAHAQWRGTPHLTRRPRHQSTHRLLILGDAAGYVEPFTGEGMAWALESGREAAALACSAIDRDDERLPARWARQHRKIVGHSQRRCALISAGLRRSKLAQLAVMLLSRTPGLAIPFVESLNTAPNLEARP